MTGNEAEPRMVRPASANRLDLPCRVTPRLNSSRRLVSHETVLEVSKIDYLTWWNFPKKAWLIIIVELGIIASLSGWLYSTYLNRSEEHTSELQSPMYL